MTMICFDIDAICFNYRVAGIALHDNRVLLNRTEDQDFWFLPGGRVEAGESSAEALKREMQEEIQETVQVGRLLWIVENFFPSGSEKDEGVKVEYHELGLYYLMNFASDSSVLLANGPFFALEGQTRMVFQWFPLEDLDRLKLYPSFLIQRLRALPEHPVHVLVDDRRA